MAGLSVPTFSFGGGAQARTPQEAARLRETTAALMARMSTPQNVGQGLGALGNAFVVRALNDRALAGETAGQAHAAELLKTLQGGSPSQADLVGAVSDPWVAQNAGESAVAQMLLQRQMASSDPGNQLDMQYKQAQIDALKAKPDAVDPASTSTGRAQLADQYGLEGSAKTEFVLTGKMPGGSQTARAGVGQPIPFRNKKTGEYINIQPMTVGPGVNTITGLPPDNPADWVPAPYDLAAQRAGGASDATNAGIARNLLPGAEQSYAITQQALGKLDPKTGDANVILGEGENFSKVFGFIPNQLIKAIVPGTPRAAFNNIINQLSGDAFLNVRQALKGAGQVTDFEGQKGEQAISRMKAAADSGNDADFRSALADFSSAMENGLALLRKQAAGDYAAGNVPGLATGGGADPLGIR